MPYIKQEERKKIDKLIVDLLKEIHNIGHLNYVVTKLIHLYVEAKAEYMGLTYKILNETIGVLTCITQEFYRTIIAKYEDKKKWENGCISQLDERTLEDVR